MMSEGRHEIDAAKQRLAAAKAQADSAAKNMELVKAMMENAESQLQSSAKEVEAAEAFLIEAEKRWEVIDVDDVHDSSQGESRKKRRKVSMSPQQGSGANASVSTYASVGKAVAGGPNAHQSNTTAALASVASVGTAATNHGGTDSEETTDMASDTIVVEGAVESEVNGAYKLVPHRKYWGAKVYCKGGRWEGESMEFVLFHGDGYWYIGVGHANTFPNECIYRTINKVYTSSPPENVDWMAINGMRWPALKLLPGVPAIVHHDSVNKVSTVIIEGCGLSDVNGTYFSSEHRKKDGVPYYWMEGQWKGRSAEFALCHSSGPGGQKCWSIMKVRGEGQAQITFYRVPCLQGNADLPPRNGWVARKAGVAPVPRLKW